MILAIILRTRDDPTMVPWNKQYYLCDYFKTIFDELGITLFPIISADCGEEVCAVCDGLIIPGSDKDIFPEYYGHERNPKCKYEIDEYSTDKKIIDAFVAAGKPIMGICAGAQVLNVYFGGTLEQYVPGHYTTRHGIHVEKDSFLYRVYGRESVEVNSYHGQMIRDVAPGFRVTARTEKGEIEAIEKDNIVAVQWHPDADLEMPFFEAFVKTFL